MIAQMLGIEPAEIEATIEQAQTLARDLDSRLEAIENRARVQTVLTAMLISELYAARTGHPADVAGVIAEAVAFDHTAFLDAGDDEPETGGEG